MLSEALSTGQLVLTAEFGPPRNPDPGPVRAAGRLLAGIVDGVNVTDNAAATVKLSPLAAAALLAAEGADPIIQLTGRDRNLLAVQAELLGAWALGVRTVLALSGDPLTVGPYEPLATHVRDVDSLALMHLISGLNRGRLAAGEELTTPTGFLIAGAANPLVDSVERLEEKLEAGVGLLQSNIVYDIDRLVRWLAPIFDAGVTERAPLLVGVMPPRSTLMLRYMQDNVPGVEVPDEIFRRMRGLEGDGAKDEGVRIAAELIEAVRQIDGVAGAHVMAPGWETEAVPRIVEAIGTRARPTPAPARPTS